MVYIWKHLYITLYVPICVCTYTIVMICVKLPLHCAYSNEAMVDDAHTKAEHKGYCNDRVTVIAVINWKVSRKNSIIVTINIATCIKPSSIIQWYKETTQVIIYL